MTRSPAPFLALTLLCAALPARAEDFRLHLDYAGRFSIFGKLLDARADGTVAGGRFQADAEMHSAGLLAIFKRIDERASSEGRIDAGEPRPSLFRYDNPRAKKYRKVSVTWTPRDVTTASSVPITFWGDPPATLEQKLEAADPLTNVMRFALAAAQGPECRAPARFFDGKQRYDLDFVDRQAVRLSDREKRLGLTDPVRCRVSYREVAGFKKKPPEKRGQGLTGPVAITFARLGQSGPWLISAIEADTHWGRASVELERVTPGG